MIRKVPGILFLLASLGAATGASAHHPPQMERCAIVSFAGQIQQIDWRMPHVELVVRANDGHDHRLTWRNIHQLAWMGIYADTLMVGDRVFVTATTLRDDTGNRPMLLNQIRRLSDGWEWVQDPQGC
jgi:hypothetical protein